MGSIITKMLIRNDIDRSPLCLPYSLGVASYGYPLSLGSNRALARAIYLPTASHQRR
jgi:hypothetical protein